MFTSRSWTRLLGTPKDFCDSLIAFRSARFGRNACSPDEWRRTRVFFAFVAFD
jgi:hypothetical protein